MFHARPESFRLLAWCLSVFFTFVSIPHFELVASEIVDLIGSPAYAAEEQVDTPAAPHDSGSPDIPSGNGQNDTPNKPDEKPQDDPNTPPEPPKLGEGTTPNPAGFEAMVPEAMLFTGAASYRVPIDVPPGRAGVAPNLAITYNSYQGNGFLGVGWNLDMRAIQRSTKRGVDYSSNKFSVVMNGSQADLVAKPGWGSNYYGSKVDETLLKYYYNSSTGGWEITAKDGQKLYYGTTSDSRQDSSLGIFKWCLDKVVDTNGNYMSVSYTKDQGAIYLDSIRYTGNTSVGPAYEVRFIKESRTDFSPMYTTNFSVTEAYRLSEIQIYGTTGSLIRKYALQYTYSTATSRSLLQSITHSGSDEIALPPTVFEYLDNEIGSLPNIYVGCVNDEGVVSTIGDTDGDGKTEIIQELDYSSLYKTYLNNGSFIRQLVLSTNNGLSYNFGTGDFNGDGKADISAGNILLSTGSSFIVQSDWAGLPTYGCGSLGDFNGDGKSDGCYKVDQCEDENDTDCIYTAVNLTNSAGTNSEGAKKWGKLTICDWWGSRTGGVGDFNGDGLSDILQRQKYGTYDGNSLKVGISTGQSFIESRWGNNEFDTTDPYAIGDFNGDGKSDVLNIDGDGVARVAISTGSSFVPYESWVSGVPFVHAFTVADFNGDGKADLLSVDGNWNPYLWVSNGKGFNSPIPWGSGADPGHSTASGDFNGDGTPDMVQIYPCGDARVWLSKAPPSDLLSKITNPLGGTSEIKYQPSSSYQNTLMPFILQTVESITASDGRGNASTTSYSYEGGLYNYSEREFLGFSKVTASTSEATTQTLFSQDLIKKGKVEQSITTSKEGHTRQVDNTYEVRSLDGGASFPALISSVTTVTDLGATPFTITNTLDYDSYLNVKSSQTSGNTSHSIVLTETQYTDFQDKWIVTKPTMVTVKDSSGEIKSRKWLDYDSTTGNLILEELCKCDDPSTGCLARNSTQNPQVTYSYYPEGNVQSITDPLGAVSSFTYDETKTHIYNKTNALGHVTTTVYDQGKLTSMTPPHLQGTGYTFSYTYDTLGRKDTETRPDGGWTKYSYNNLGSPSEQYIQQQEHIVGGAEVYSDLISKSYFDGLGRTYLTVSPGAEGPILVETRFDNLGRIAQKSNPYYQGNTSYWTTLSYDGLSRVISATAPDNSVVSTAYQGLKRIITDQLGRSTTYVYDIYNRLAVVRDAKGTNTLYFYDVLGNLCRVEAAYRERDPLPEHNVTTVWYDSLSKKRTMIDPDMGQWTYEYDKAGNLLTQTDALGRITSFTYDALGRVTKKLTDARVDPDYEVTYTYDDPSVSYSRGHLTNTSTLYGSDQVKGFDLMQRPTVIKKHIALENGQTRQTQKSYDSAGRLATIKYFSDAPNEKLYSYHYGSGGNLSTIQDSRNNPVVQYLQYTALGQTQRAEYPKYDRSGQIISTPHTDYTYSPETGRLESLKTSATNSSGETILQWFEYEFDAKGNLKVLRDLCSGSTCIPDNLTTHTYGYDELDRLTSAQGTGKRPYTQQYQYDVLGNITSKSDVGDYSYQYGNKPHAVRTARGITLDYDANGNMTSRTDTAKNIATTVKYTANNKPWEINLADYGTNTGANLTFAYDGAGRRIYKVSRKTPGVPVTIFYFGEEYEQTDGEDVYHLFGRGRVASFHLDGTAQFYHSDHLGSTSVVTNEQGNLVQQIGYHPFGTYLYASNNQQPVVKYTFTGQEADDEIGLYNYNARLYDPILGRFISADTIVPEPGNLQSLNRYSYCLNNPLIYTDPSGHIFGIDDILIGMAIGALIGGIMSAVQGQNIGLGILTGAIAGACFGAVGGYYPAGSVMVCVTHAGAGAVAGGINAAITGSNIGMGMLVGGAFGAVSQAVGVPNFSPFGSSALGSIGNRIFNSAVTGAALGAAYAGVTGRNIGEGALMGASAWAIGEGVNMGVGHLVGYVGSGFQPPEFQDGYFTYDCSEFGGTITFGNVISGPKSTWQQETTINGQPDPQGRTVLDHEKAHCKQDTVLGPGYMMAHGVSLTVGAGIGELTGEGYLNGSHTYNILERKWIDVPCW